MGRQIMPFNFNLEHIQGKNKGFADYLSRHPKQNHPHHQRMTHIT